MSTHDQKKSARKTFWTIALFYGLIAFEFFYMAGPFGIYFYSIYKPGLNFLNQVPGMAWLISFFLPHVVVDTSSTIVNLHNIAGAVLAILGFLMFCMGAGQVYYFKLKKKGAVTGGIYNYIRHPQYASFALCSFGLLLLWPRYLVLVMFVTVLFAYYFLARLEERECEEKFGQSYVEYKNRTQMFLPFKIPWTDKLLDIPPQPRIGKWLSVMTLYALTILLSLDLAQRLQSLSLNSLYAVYLKDSAYISVTKIDQENMANLIEIALANEDIQACIDNVKGNANTKFLNYLLPAEWYISEIPMNIVECNSEHFLQSSNDYNKNFYKIIFTKANLRTDQNFEGKELLVNTINITPIVEVWLNVSQQKVVDIKQPPETIMYENVPVPVY